MSKEKSRVFPRTKGDLPVTLGTDVYNEGVLNTVFSRLNIPMFDDKNKINQNYTEILNHLKVNVNQNRTKLQISELSVSQTPTFCGGGLIEGVNELMYFDEDDMVSLLTDVLEYILHCRNCYKIQHKGGKVSSHPTYYHDEFENASRIQIISKLNGTVDSLFGFSYLTCNLACDDDEDNIEQVSDVLKGLGFKLSNTTKNIKTENKIFHFTLNIEDYVKTKQPTKPSKSKKAQVTTTI